MVVNAAGCGSAMKDYGHVLRDEPDWAERAAAFAERVRDVSEFLAEAGPRAERRPVELRVAYHDACHLAHAQGVRAQPRELLRGIPGLELLEPDEWELCCGSAGIYNLVQPEPAAELGERKARNLLDTGARGGRRRQPGLRAPDHARTRSAWAARSPCCTRWSCWPAPFVRGQTLNNRSDFAEWHFLRLPRAAPCWAREPRSASRRCSRRGLPVRRSSSTRMPTPSCR